MKCPHCESERIVKNGINGVGTPKFQCNNCCRQFVENPIWFPISQEQKDLIDRLLLEKISLAGIARVLQISKTWLQNYVNNKYENTPQKITFSCNINLDVDPVIECDELWSFVGKKKEKQWVWLALDKNTREIIGVYIGDRSADSAKKLFNSIPAIYSLSAHFYTDYWAAYNSAIPSDQHTAVGKESGKTNHIERFNNTLRQRVSRLVRDTLSFSKKIENHIGAIWYFIHHYNAQIRMAS